MPATITKRTIGWIHVILYSCTILGLFYVRRWIYISVLVLIYILYLLFAQLVSA